MAAVAPVVLLCTACGAARSHDTSAQRVVARRFVALVASSQWQRAATLETAGNAATKPGSIERQIHDTIRELGVRVPGRIHVRRDSILVVLRGRQRLRRGHRVVAIRPAAVFVTLSFAREDGRWRIAVIEYSQTSRLVLVRHAKRP